MCKKTKGIHNRIEPCLKPLLKWLKSCDYEVVASCCGHSVYPMTIIVRGTTIKETEGFSELFSGKVIPRSRKFYKKDKRGFYYIPELNSEGKFFSSQP
jgi:hypothetical protein